MNHLIPEGFLEEMAQRTSSLDPLFLYADSVRGNEIPARKALSEAERDRLVKGSKSQTSIDVMDLAYKKHNFEFNALKLRECEPSLKSAVVHEYPEYERVNTAKDAVGCKAIIEYREFQEAYRVRTEVECSAGMKPPEQAGSRESEMLTSRGATKIAESCEFMHLKKGGYKTFVTGTFNDEVREKIASGETSIQKEVTRTMDAMKKMYSRGWYKKDGSHVSGHKDGFCYLWVVEVPENKDGEPNPHVHMLLGWRVEYKDFKEWASRIENIWGNGYFHLEKIQDSACAGAYMAKAAGYLCKAQDKGDQGKVEGNRYGISREARAPAWVQISTGQLHTMGQLIYDVYDHLTVKYGDKYRERKRLNKKLSETPREEKGKRKKIGERLAKVRAELKKIPIRANKYQLVITGKGAAFAFFNWLETPTSAGAVCEEWLPEKLEGWEWRAGEKPHARNNQFFSRLRQKLSRRRLMRRLNPPSWVSETFSDEYWHQVKNDLFAPSLLCCPPAPPVVSDLYQ